MTWIAPSPAPIPAGPLVGDERPILAAFLAAQRHILQNLCAGLTGEQLAQRAVVPSNLSLLGLVRHMTKVERIWFRQRAAGEDVPDMYDPADGKDADFNLVVAAQAPAALDRFGQECRLADAAAAGLSLDHPVLARDETLSLRLVYVHMIAEYARHNGHADLLRERIDGTTGL